MEQQIHIISNVESKYKDTKTVYKVTFELRFVLYIF